MSASWRSFLRVASPCCAWSGAVLLVDRRLSVSVGDGCLAPGVCTRGADGNGAGAGRQQCDLRGGSSV